MWRLFNLCANHGGSIFWYLKYIQSCQRFMLHDIQLNVGFYPRYALEKDPPWRVFGALLFVWHFRVAMSPEWQEGASFCCIKGHRDSLSWQKATSVVWFWHFLARDVMTSIKIINNHAGVLARLVCGWVGAVMQKEKKLQWTDRWTNFKWGIGSHVHMTLKRRPIVDRI